MTWITLLLPRCKEQAAPGHRLWTLCDLATYSIPSQLHSTRGPSPRTNQDAPTYPGTRAKNTLRRLAQRKMSKIGLF
eukprot:406859-Rhodomonas_salina.1